MCDFFFSFLLVFGQSQSGFSQCLPFFFFYQKLYSFHLSNRINVCVFVFVGKSQTMSSRSYSPLYKRFFVVVVVVALITDVDHDERKVPLLAFHSVVVVVVVDGGGVVRGNYLQDLEMYTKVTPSCINTHTHREAVGPTTSQRTIKMNEINKRMNTMKNHHHHHILA